MPDIVLVDDRRTLDAALGETDVDVVLAACREPRNESIARGLLQKSNASRIVLLSDTGKDVVVYDLSSRLFEVAELSAAELLDVLRHSLQPAM